MLVLMVAVLLFVRALAGEYQYQYEEEYPDEGTTNQDFQAEDERGECSTAKDCYVEPEVLDSLVGKHLGNNCFIPKFFCVADRETGQSFCLFEAGMAFCYQGDKACQLRAGAVGNCTQVLADCRAKLVPGGPRECEPSVNGGTRLKSLATATGIQLQQGSPPSSKPCGKRPGSQTCWTKLGKCCKKVWNNKRLMCPFFC